MGPSGAGKSTVANLLQRYYDVSSGAVTINGNDVRELALEDLRKKIGVVAQDPFLFDLMTIPQNVGSFNQYTTKYSSVNRTV